jgi:hypothetical protein
MKKLTAGGIGIVIVILLIIAWVEFGPIISPPKQTYEYINQTNQTEIDLIEAKRMGEITQNGETGLCRGTLISDLKINGDKIADIECGPQDLRIEVEGCNYTRHIGVNIWYDLWIDTSNQNTTCRIIAANNTKEQAFFKANNNLFLADILETTYAGKGQGDITGTREYTKTWGSWGLFGGQIYSYPISYPIHDKLTFDFTMNPKYPTVRMNETEFLATREKLGVIARCVKLENKAYKLPTDEYAHILLCTYEKDGVHFLSQIESIEDEQTADKVILDATAYQHGNWIIKKFKLYKNL